MELHLVLPAIVVFGDANKAREVLEFSSGLTQKSMQFSSVHSKRLLLRTLEKEPWVISGAGGLTSDVASLSKMRDILSSSR